MTFKQKLHQIIFGYDTPEGRLFDIILIFAIFGSVVVVMLDSVSSIHLTHGVSLVTTEWFFTILFTLEYFARIYSSDKPIKYIFSFYGLIDLLSTIPTYLALIVPGGETLLILRVFRLMRVFRIFKLGHYVKGSEQLLKSLKENRFKIIAFLFFVLAIVVFIGSIMYIIEGSENGFTSIPRSIYWAIVTVTTVGFGDISPQTNLGQFFASMLMLVGYAIIAVPTGIISSGIRINTLKKEEENNLIVNKCQRCMSQLHSLSDNYCWKCGEELNK
jgi:voltage-gated potassium channel